MVYNDFTLETVVETFQLEVVETLGLFSDIEPIIPRPHFTTDLEERVKLAFAVNTHKAKSEFVISYILLEGQRLHIDLALYQIVQSDKILGILASMVEQKA